jgi:hypothetical protein
MVSILSFVMARQLAGAAAAAYRQSTVNDRRTNACANVTMDSGGNIIVAFKGSSEPVDFLQDAKFEMTGLNWPDIEAAVKVHTGFREDFNAIKEESIKQVRQLLGQSMGSRGALPSNTTTRQSDNSFNPGVFITGHSLGGALAILCALEFCRELLPVSGVYTFGQPRVGNAAFANLFDATFTPGGCNLKDITFRMVNQNDIVPRTPGWLLGYRHCGNEVFLPPGSVTNWELNPGLFWNACSDVIGLCEAWREHRDVLVSEHFLSAYSRRMQLID